MYFGISVYFKNYRNTLWQLVNSSISGSTLLGNPSDVYLTGTMFFWMTVAMCLCTPATAYIYLPIFHRLQVVSANQVRTAHMCVL